MHACPHHLIHKSNKMKVFVALFALLAAAAAKPNQLQDRAVLYPNILKHSQGKTPFGRIVGGEIAEPHEYPWQVALQIDGLYFCGGSIIADNVVLTAAHCLDGANSVVITAGAQYWQDDEPTQQKKTATNLRVHEGWNSASLDNDLATATLDDGDSFDFDENVQAISIAESVPEAGYLATATGFGKTSDSGSVSPVLMTTQVPIADDSACDIYGLDFSTKICTKVEDGHGTCNGDSGGPLITDDRVQIGLVSFGPALGCASGLPDGFTDLTEFRDWLGVA